MSDLVKFKHMQEAMDEGYVQGMQEQVYRTIESFLKSGIVASNHIVGLEAIIDGKHVNLNWKFGDR